VALTSHTRLVTAAGVAALTAAYAWFVTGLYPFTWQALAGTFTGGVAVVAAVRQRGARRRAMDPKTAGWRAGAVVWAVLFLALGAWELAAFVQHPRADHPTLSSLATGVFDSHAIRATAFLAWLGMGAVLARR
jgi:hypothetical protein